MNGLMFRFPLMAEAGVEGGGGGAGGEPAGGTGALAGAGESGAAGGEGGAGTGEAGAGANAGALAGAGNGGTTAEGAIDWDKITTEEYFGKVQIPEIEGCNVNAQAVSKRYGEFCRKHHISPEAVGEFLKLEGDAFMKGLNESNAAKAKEAAELKANFDAQGEALHKAFNKEQIGQAVKVLGNTFAGDKDFMKVATSLLANNTTLVKLLLNWGEHHGTDTTAGAGSGAGGDGERGFASRWTGKNI